LHTILETLNARNIENEVDISIDPISLSCTNSTRKYQVGSNITSVMREVRRSFFIISYIIKNWQFDFKS